MSEPRGINRRLSINVTAALINRFNEGVDRGEPGECWNWIKGFRNGYGAIKHEGRVLSAHRLAYVIANGEPDESELVTHQCDNRACCNPAHLIAASPQQNVKDMYERGEVHTPRGEQCGHAVLNEQLVSQIWSHRRRGLGAIRIARDMGLTQDQVARVLTGKGWKHLRPSWAT